MDNKIKALLIGLLIVLSAFVGAVAFPKKVEVLKEVQVEKIVTNTEFVEVEVPVEKLVEVEKLVDNGDLDMVLQYLEDNYGNKDVFEDVADIVSNIKFEDELKLMAVDYVKENWLDLLDDYGVLDDEFDYFRESELKLYKVYDDMEDIEIGDVDYEDKEGDIYIEFKVKANDGDDEKDSYKFALELSYSDEELEDFDLYVVS